MFFYISWCFKMNSDKGKSIDKEFHDDFFNSLKRKAPTSQIESKFYAYSGYVRNMEALGRGYDTQLYNQAFSAFERWKKHSK